MSRLDSAIRRLTAQRSCLEHAAALVADLPGPILELGLGNGRTYDHLCEMLPDREIFVFERKVAAHPDCVPDESHLLLGDFLDTLPQALDRVGRPAALAHADIFVFLVEHSSFRRLSATQLAEKIVIDACGVTYVPRF